VGGGRWVIGSRGGGGGVGAPGGGEGWNGGRGVSEERGGKAGSKEVSLGGARARGGGGRKRKKRGGGVLAPREKVDSTRGRVMRAEGDTGEGGRRDVRQWVKEGVELQRGGWGRIWRM